MLDSTGSSPSPTLLGLVDHYSPSGQEADAVEFLVGHMRELGYTNSLVDPAGNAIGVMGDGDVQLVLLGHIDTVPGQVPVRIEGDLLYGRGTTDAKGPLANFVDSVAALGPVPGLQIVVVGAVEEEGDSRGAFYVRSNYNPSFAIIGEPSGWDRITLGYKGIHTAATTLRAAVRHGAARDSTTSELAVALWNTIRAWSESYNSDRSAIFEQVTPRLRGLQGGSDGFGEWTRLEIQTRLPPGVSPEEWQAEFTKLVEPAEVEVLGNPLPAYLGSKSNAVVRAFLGSIREAGGKPGFVVKSGTADMNVVGSAWDCPMVAYGPGDSSVDHTPDEHISLAEFSRAGDVLKKALARLTGLA